MFKLSIALIVLVGLASSEDFSWESIPRVGNMTQCFYRPEEKMLGCRGLNTTVECGVVGRLPTGFGAFGIGRKVVEGVSVESTGFWLYPRELNHTTYLNHVLTFENGTQNVTLLQSESIVDTLGLGVSDVKCWTRLVDLFNGSLIMHVNIEKPSTEIEIMGEIVLFDKSFKKRFLFGIGLPVAIAPVVPVVPAFNPFFLG